MRTKPLNELFHVAYGNKLDMNKMDVAPKGVTGVNFVGRSSQNHGVTGVVSRVLGVEPYPAGCVTVSLGGSKLLSSFVQMEPFYTAQNVAVLQPKTEMAFAEKLFVCLCIRHNRFRYSAFGREANRTLRTLPIPDPSEFPGWLEGIDVSEVERSIEAPILAETRPLDPAAWKAFRLDELFDVRKGKRLTQADMKPGDVPFIGAIDRNNGMRQRIGAEARHHGNVITLTYNGSVAEAFYQPRPGGCVRLGGHLEGYVRPSDAHIGRPAPNVDQLLIAGHGGVHHVWGCDAFKTTLDAAEYKRVYKHRTDLVKQAMDAVPAGDRAALVEAIMGAIRQGGLFSVNVDIVPSAIGRCAHVVLSAATSGEMNLTSMNGERRLRLTERYMDPPGQALPDCLIVARLAQALEASWRAAGRPEVADRFRGYDWRSEEDAFMDGYHRHEEGGEFVSYDRLRAMGTNGVQTPARGFEDGQIVGTQRLYEDGVFDRAGGRAEFCATQWRGLQAAGKQEEKERYRFLINNGRANHIWQSAFLDQHNALVADRFPFPPLLMHEADVDDLGLRAGDLVEVWNSNGATQAVVWPEQQTRRGETFLVYAHPAGPAGNVVSKATNELVIPNFKQTWADIRKLADPPEAVRHLSFKVQGFRTQSEGASSTPDFGAARDAARSAPNP